MRLPHYTLERSTIGIQFVSSCARRGCALGTKQFSLITGLFLIGFLPLSAQVQREPRERIAERGLPIVFEPAASQRDTSVSMIGRMAGATVGFRPAAIDVYAGKQSSGFEISFDGAGSAAPRGADLEQSWTNYLLGNNPVQWRTHVANYGKVVYSNLYAGVDAVFYGNGDHLEHDFIVKPGADYRQIRMRFPRGARVDLNKDGALIVRAPGDSLQMKAPFIYQDVDGKRQERRGAFRVLPGGDIGFTVANYDPNVDLIIDPALIFSTYLSQYSSDGVAIAVDAIGNSYVTGFASLGYPVTEGAFSGCAACASNTTYTFVSKLSADGTKLIYSTLLGGNSFAQSTGIAVDANGDAIVSGWTAASNFPTKSGQPILPQDNNYVGFLVSLSPDGSSLNYGTLLSSSPTATHTSMTYATAVALDSAGNAYVTGETGSGFFISNGALNQVATGSITNNFDVFLAKFGPSGSLVYSAVLGTADPQNGGGGPIGASALAVDSAGDAYVTGQAGALWPTTSGAYLNQISGSNPYAAPFVIKVAPDATSVVYSTYLDYAYAMSGISVLANGNVFVVGNGAGTSYPTTPNAYEQNNGNGTSFLSELNASGSLLVYSTMVCGGSCTVNGMAIDSKGNIWLAAQTSNLLFPLAMPLQSILPIGITGVGPVSALSEFDPAGQTLEFSTFLGGVAPGYASSVAIDPSLRVYVSGAAEYGLYTTAGVYAGSVPVPAPAYASSTYAYVAVVDPTVAAPALCASPNSSLSFATAVGSYTENMLTIKSCGADPLSITGVTTSLADFSVPASENECIQTLPAGQSCTLYVRFTPTVAGSQSATLSIASNSPIPAVLSMSGNGLTAPIMTLSATSITFGPQLVGTESAPQTITINNTGDAALNGIGFGMLAADEPIFPLTYTCGPSLGPGASCTFSVAFKPASTGTTTATMTVENSSGLPFQQVTLTGTSPQSPFLIGTQTGGSMSSTVTAGSTATYELTITPAGGYSGTVNLSCSSLPANASCTFNPSSLALAGGTAANFMLSVATESTETAAVVHTAGLGVVLAGLLFLMPLKQNRKVTIILICLGAALLIASVSACGGSSSASSNPQSAKVSPGTYTIQVVASDASGNQLTQNITLVVQ